MREDFLKVFNSKYKINKKALAKISIYIMIVIFFALYQFYFISNNTELIFAATPIVFSGNQSTPASPSTYSATTNKSFSLIITPTDAPVDSNGVIFQLGRNITSSYTNFTRCANGGQTGCTWNDSVGVFRINFTGPVFDQSGVSNFTWFANDSANMWNNTDIVQYTLNQGNPTLTFTIDSTAGGVQKTYSGKDQTTSLATTCGFPGNDGSYPTCTLFRSDASIGTGNLSVTTTEGNSTIYYNYTSASNANWTGSSLNRTLKVLKGIPVLNLSINVSSPITYGTGVQARGGNCTMTGATDISCVLYRGNSTTSNSSSTSTSGWVTDQLIPGVGTIAYNFSTAGGANWTATSASNVTLVTTPASQGTSFSVSPGSTVTYPTETTASCARTSGDSGSTIYIYRNGTLKASGTSSPQSEIATLSAGTYNYTCVVGATTNYSQVTSVDRIVTVSPSGSMILTITLNQGAFVAYGTSTTAQGNGCPTSGADDVTCKLYRNDSLKATYPPTSFETIILGAGNYSYVYNSTGGVNYTSATSSASILSVNKITPSISVSISPGASVNYPTPTTGQCARVSGDSSSTITLYRNGTQVASGTSSPQSETITLASGGYNYSCTLSATQNYTASSSVNNNLVVNPATPSISVSFSPGSTTTYPTTTTGQCARVSGDSSSLITLLRNGSVVASGTSSPQYETLRLGAGNYNYSCTIGAAGNYSAGSSVDNNLAVSQNTSTSNFMNLTINGTEGNKSYSFPAGSNATVWYNSNAFIDSAFSFTLYRNSTIIGSTNPVYDVQNPNAGAYNYTYFTSGNANYSSARKNYFMTIGQATPSISVSFIPSATVTYPTSTIAGCGRINGDSSSTITLYRNGTQVASGTSSPQYENTTILAVGAYNYTCTINETQNYTAASSVDKNLIVSKGTTQIRLFLNGTEADKTYSANKWANFTASLNVSGKTVYITSDYLGFGTQSGTTPFTYAKKLITEGTFNITAYFDGDSDYSSSVQTYYATVSANCMLKGNAFYVDTGNEIASGTVTYIIKETGDTDSVSFTNGYFELPCAFPNVPGKRVTVGIIVSSSDNKLGYVQLIAGGGSSTAQTQECSTKQWYFNGTAADIVTGRQISQGNVSVSVMGTRYINTTYFSNGEWGINLSPCLISGQVYTFQFAISGENKLSVAFVNQVAK